MAGEEMLYISGLEADETRKLWHDCFPEDSESFMNYYYEEKVKDNQLLIKKQNGFLAAMAHVNPYLMRVKEELWEIGYIVGVATEESRRHQGHMRDILLKLMNDMSAERVPFTFLMPAAKEIYLPFDFTFIYNQPAFKLRDGMQEKLVRTVCTDTPEDCEKAAEYMMHRLSTHYEVYCIRDVNYVSRLIKELAGENGTLEFLYDGAELVGLQAYWGTQNREQRLLYAEDYYIEESAPAKPSIMARITSVEQFLLAFRLKASDRGAMVVKLIVEDPLIENNNQSFFWTLTGDGSRVAVGEELRVGEHEEPKVRESEEMVSAAELKSAETASAVVLSLKVQELASWLFGYKKPEELWPDLNADQLSKLASIDVVGKIFIDEVV
ncbi:MAG: GNAT family N-acetyltransferase [Clostridium sp.]